MFTRSGTTECEHAGMSCYAALHLSVVFVASASVHRVISKFAK